MSLTNHAETFSVAKRVQSIRHAVRGVTEMLKSEHNAWVHLFATVCVVLAAAVLSVNATEWCFLILAIMAVWVSEASCKPHPPLSPSSLPLSLGSQSQFVYL